MQAHLFALLRPLVSKHTDIRDCLARCRGGDMPMFERVLSMVEFQVAKAIEEDARNRGGVVTVSDIASTSVPQSSVKEQCARPWWVCQPYLRPLPEEALAKGSIQLSKKDKRRLEREREELIPGKRNKAHG